ncbi:cytochrome P450 [Gloeopeniophorella convolvens]|nr:cytochrome P450 [Gloeopeniophorella convolvens]
MTAALPFLNSGVVALIICLAFLTLARKAGKQRRQSLPPGPRGWPIIGNLFDIPARHSWLAYVKMGQKYGSDIISVQVLGQVIVVLNSVRAAKDLLEKCGDVYSDRPPVPFFDMMDWNGYEAMLRYPEPWRSSRKVLDRCLRPGSVALYRPMQLAKARSLLNRLLECPEELQAHIELLQGEIILSMTYGYDVKERDDKFLVLAKKLVEIAAPSFLPGAALVNQIPLLQHIPGWIPWLSYQPHARLGRDGWQEVIHTSMRFAKESIETGTATQSFVLENLQEIQGADDAKRDKAESLISTALASIYVAGADTTVNAMMTFFLAVLLHPNVQTMAQAELDAVTGRERLPTFEDRPNLPYVDAICKEVMRWNTVAPVGVPHATTEDSMYKGWFIPKGSAMLRDPVTYSDPDAFKPERFLDADGDLIDDPTISVAFGFGKRICPGRHVADATLFIVVASLLSVFKVQKPRAPEGREIPFDYSYTGALLNCPNPFPCSVVSRDGKAEALITAEAMSR